MARATPMVRQGQLAWSEAGVDHVMVVGTSDWYDWLASATTFALQSESGSFTARKERGQRGGWYWKAYRTRRGVSYRAYLGKTQDLSLDRLEQVARALAQHATVAERGHGKRSSSHLQTAQPGDRRGETPAVQQDIATGNGPRHRDTWSSPGGEVLFAPKLYIPPARAGLVFRPRLIALLGEKAKCPLVLVAAPAGYGKTTLLSQWIGHAQPHVAWLSLDAADTDPMRFWRHVFATLGRVAPYVGEYEASVLQGSQPPSPDRVATCLANAALMLREDITLVLDDYHFITNQDIHDALALLLDHLPPPLHLIIAARSDPPLPVARLIAHAQATRLDVNDLRFTAEEVSAYLAQFTDLGLSARDMVELETHTEGWITGLQLTTLSLRAHGDIPGVLRAFTAGTHPALVDYLVEEVLQRQPEDVQTFLLCTSLLDRLSGPLCEVILGHDHALGARPADGQEAGQALLERLERANLFLIPLDAERQWYRYHHLFAEVLSVRFRREQPTHALAVHRRAAAWYERTGLFAQAIQHALAAQDFSHAAAMIEHVAEPLMHRGEVTTVLGWLDTLPDDVVRSNARLCVLHAMLLRHTGRLHIAEARLQDAERALASMRPPIQTGVSQHLPVELPREARRVLGQINYIRGTIASNQREYLQARERYRQALDLLPAEGDDREDQVDCENTLALREEIALQLAYIADFEAGLEAGIAAFQQVKAMSLTAGRSQGVIAAQCGLAILLRNHGRLHEAAAEYRSAVRLALEQPGGPLPEVSQIHMGLGAVLYNWNDLDAASSHLSEALRLHERWGDMGVWARCQELLGRIKAAQGDLDGVREVLGRIEQMGRRVTLRPNLVARAAASCAALWLAVGDVDQARQWIREARVSVQDELSPVREYRHLILAYVLLAQGAVDDVLPFLDRLYDAAAARDEVDSMLRIRVAQALGHQAQHDIARATRFLLEALVLAEPGGYIRPILDSGPRVATLLAHAARVRRKVPQSVSRQGSVPAPTVSLPYVKRLMDAAEAQGDARRSAADRLTNTHFAVEPLANRELEILRLVASGMSNDEIARDLVLESSTVKWHLTNIYGKLNVRSRTQAAVQARALGLL